MSNRLPITLGAFRRALVRGEPGDLQYRFQISIWVRWLLLVAWLAQTRYRLDLDDPNYVPNMAFAAVLISLNGYVHYRLRSNRGLTWHWALALSAIDVAMLTSGLAGSSGFHNSCFVLYYPMLAIFAAVFTSVRLSFAWVTMVAALYAGVSFIVEPGLDFDAKDEKVLFMRIVTMYGVMLAVNLVSRAERIRRMEAVKREGELHRQRINLSTTINDTMAQSAYLVGLGIESARELVDDSDRELIAKLEATHSLSQSIMWELRHPIDAGPIFEGRELSRVLRSHASTFSTITSIPTEVVLTGKEPELSTITRGLLFSVAHNAMTNSYRHSKATKVIIGLEFGPEQLRMTVSDDGIGLPDDYEERGHGFRNMRADMERVGGWLEAALGEPGSGAAVSCTVPYGNLRRARSLAS